jgi:hypothetical protein
MLRRKFNQLAFRQNIMMANLKKFAQCLLGNKSDISGMKRDEFHSNIVQGFFYYMHELKWIFRLIFFSAFLVCDIFVEQLFKRRVCSPSNAKT